MSNSKDLLVEIGTEDLPAKPLLQLSDEFASVFCNQLISAKLSFSKHKALCTPRRLAVIVKNLDIFSNDSLIESLSKNINVKI